MFSAEHYYFILLCAYIPFHFLIQNIFLILQRKARASKKFRNDLLSLAYILINTAPSFTGFSCVGIFLSTNEAQYKLFFLFFIGVAMQFFGRRLRDFIAQKTLPEIKKADSMLDMTWKNK